MRFFSVFFAVFLINHTATAAPDIQIKGKITQVIPTSNSNNKINTNQPIKITQPKKITLLNVQLSEHAFEVLNKRAEKIKKSPISPELLAYSTATSTQLGMNQVPVLDQGEHGTCATFATTAALDAALNKGDYISQLCHLQLGQYLENFGYNPSGWDGSLGALVLNQIESFGIVNKAVQREVGCGGFTEYSEVHETPTEPLSLADYHEISEPLPDEIESTSLLDVTQVFLDRTNPQRTLELVKDALRNNDRLTFGILLFGLNAGNAGAAGQHHQPNDTWLLTADVSSNLILHKNYGGHAMVITGFDDLATAVDQDGYAHQGLLTIRNSWGEHVGDNGNFYMSYDFFKLLTIEVQRIRSLKRFKI
ncbi:MAG: C1 family peptidase [Legionella sp.]|nr:C1 family peptidase [Legionella sp.]